MLIDLFLIGIMHSGSLCAGAGFEAALHISVFAALSKQLGQNECDCACLASRLRRFMCSIGLILFNVYVYLHLGVRDSFPRNRFIFLAFLSSFFLSPFHPAPSFEH